MINLFLYLNDLILISYILIINIKENDPSQKSKEDAKNNKALNDDKFIEANLKDKKWFWET